MICDYLYLRSEEFRQLTLDNLNSEGEQGNSNGPNKSGFESLNMNFNKFSYKGTILKDRLT